MTHDTQAARLADEAKRLADEYANCHYKHMRTVALRTELHAAIDALRDLAIPAGEAVAWRVSHPVSGDIFRDTEPDGGVYPPSYTVTPLYASPQPTLEASQDGGARPALCSMGVGCDEAGVCYADAHGDPSRCPRSPLPGRESTAQAGAVAWTPRCAYCDDTGDVVSIIGEWRGYCTCAAGVALKSSVPKPNAQAGAATESSSERSSGCLNSSGLAQTLTSETTSPSVLAMREALGKAERCAVMMSDVIDNHCIAMQAAVIEAERGKGLAEGISWIANTLDGPGLYPDLDEAERLGGAQAWFDAKTAEHNAFRAANPGPASTLPEPRAGETEPEPPAGCACVLTLSEGMLDAAIRALMWAPTEGNRTRLRGGLEAALAAATPSPIATPKPQEERLLTVAIRMLADWCVDVDLNGTGWDDWDENYKEAYYRPGPLRELINAEVAIIKRERGIVPQDGDRGPWVDPDTGEQRVTPRPPPHKRPPPIAKDRGTGEGS